LTALTDLTRLMFLMKNKGYLYHNTQEIYVDNRYLANFGKKNNKHKANINKQKQKMNRFGFACCFELGF